MGSLTGIALKLIGGIVMTNKLKELVLKLQDDINWENWTDDNGHYFKSGGVIFSQLEWIKEGIDDDEFIDILDKVQRLVCPILDELDDEVNK